MKRVFMLLIFFIIVSSTCKGQPSPRLIYYFNGNKTDIRTYFNKSDTTITIEFIDNTSSPQGKYQIDTITLRAYHQKASRALSIPEIVKTSPSKIEIKPSIVIPIKNQTTGFVDLLAVNVGAVYKYGDGPSTRQKLN